MSLVVREPNTFTNVATPDDDDTPIIRDYRVEVSESTIERMVDQLRQAGAPRWMLKRAEWEILRSRHRRCR